MTLEEFLRYRDTDLSSVEACARAAVGLEADDVLLVVGSLVEGLGNSKSDLDLLLITSRGESSFSSREVPLVVGSCLADVQILHRTELEELLARLETWSGTPWQLSQATKFTLEERRLLHRLRHSLTLHEGPDNRISARIPGANALARLKLHVARQIARTIQVDMVGNRECRDYPTLVFAAQELLGHAADALAAGHQLTNPTAKWRSRLLQSLPDTWEHGLMARPTGLPADQLFWRLHRAPEHPEERSALEHAFRATTFARAVFMWAERRLVDGAVDDPNPIKWPRLERTPQDIPLPYLDFDVDIFVSDGIVTAGRLNEFSDTLEMSSHEFAATFLFDGITTAREAEAVVYGAYSNEIQSSPVNRLVARLAHTNLSVPSNVR
jgi:hypothetical protein